MLELGIILKLLWCSFFLLRIFVNIGVLNKILKTVKDVVLDLDILSDEDEADGMSVG
jgi:hypothetical protein